MAPVAAVVDSAAPGNVAPVAAVVDSAAPGNVAPGSLALRRGEPDAAEGALGTELNALWGKLSSKSLPVSGPLR